MLYKLMDQMLALLERVTGYCLVFDNGIGLARLDELEQPLPFMPQQGGGEIEIA